MPQTTPKYTILYADDDSDDVFMVQQAFQQYHGTVDLLHANDGYETLQQLNACKEQHSLPCLVILDINMPGMDGKDTLVRLKESEDFNGIPIVLFTTSSSDGDKAFAEKWGAKFITKPLIYSELEQLAQTFLSLCSQPARINR